MTGHPVEDRPFDYFIDLKDRVGLGFRDDRRKLAWRHAGLLLEDGFENSVLKSAEQNAEFGKFFGHGA